jgi:hypothetical protein
MDVAVADAQTIVEALTGNGGQMTAQKGTLCNCLWAD